MKGKFCCDEFHISCIGNTVMLSCRKTFQANSCTYTDVQSVEKILLYCVIGTT
jgi:hypothetical protein